MQPINRFEQWFYVKLFHLLQYSNVSNSLGGEAENAGFEGYPDNQENEQQQEASNEEEDIAAAVVGDLQSALPIINEIKSTAAPNFTQESSSGTYYSYDLSG